MADPNTQPIPGDPLSGLAQFNDPSFMSDVDPRQREINRQRAYGDVMRSIAARMQSQAEAVPQYFQGGGGAGQIGVTRSPGWLSTLVPQSMALENLNQTNAMQTQLNTERRAGLQEFSKRALAAQAPENMPKMDPKTGQPVQPGQPGIDDFTTYKNNIAKLIAEGRQYGPSAAPIIEPLAARLGMAEKLGPPQPSETYAPKLDVFGRPVAGQGLGVGKATVIHPGEAPMVTTVPTSGSLGEQPNAAPQVGSQVGRPGGPQNPPNVQIGQQQPGDLILRPEYGPGVYSTQQDLAHLFKLDDKAPGGSVPLVGQELREAHYAGWKNESKRRIEENPVTQKAREADHLAFQVANASAQHYGADAILSAYMALAQANGIDQNTILQKITEWRSKIIPGTDRLPQSAENDILANSNMIAYSRIAEAHRIANGEAESLSHRTGDPSVGQAMLKEVALPQMRKLMPAPVRTPVVPTKGAQQPRTGPEGEPQAPTTPTSTTPSGQLPKTMEQIDREFRQNKGR